MSPVTLLSVRGLGFDPARWPRDRSTREFDIEDVGALVVPVPTAKQLCQTVRSRYAFLADLDPDERTLARADERGGRVRRGGV